MIPTPPGGTAATPDVRVDGESEGEAVPPQRTGLEPLPQRVRGASGITEADEEPEHGRPLPRRGAGTGGRGDAPAPAQRVAGDLTPVTASRRTRPAARRFGW